MFMIEKNILKTVTKAIYEYQLNIILIMGPGVVGKIYISQKISDYLNHQDLKASAIELDGFILDRTIRMKNGWENGWITAHNPSAFDLSKDIEIVENLMIKNIAQNMSIHNKSIHGVEDYLTIYPSDVYIIEGTVAFYLQKLSAIFEKSIRIFINASKQTQFHNRFIREKREIGYDLDTSLKRFKFYWRDYIQYILPFRDYSDIQFEIDKNYSITSFSCSLA